MYTLKTIKCCWQRLKRRQINGETLCIHGLKDLYCLRCHYYPEGSTDSMQSLSKSQGHGLFFSEIKSILRFVISQRILNSQNYFEKEKQSWRTHVSQFQNFLQSYNIRAWYWHKDRYTDQWKRRVPK